MADPVQHSRSLQAGALQFSSNGDFTVEINGERFPVLERELLRDRRPAGRPRLGVSAVEIHGWRASCAGCRASAAFCFP